jgi:hypothetical protein
LKNSTPNCIVYGELGRSPLDVFVKSRIDGFWSRIVNGKKDKISYILYKLLYRLDVCGVVLSQWLNCIRNPLYQCNMQQVWNGQFNVGCDKSIRYHVKTIIKGKFRVKLCNTVVNIVKCLNYRISKTEYGLEPYIIQFARKLLETHV